MRIFVSLGFCLAFAVVLFLLILCVGGCAQKSSLATAEPQSVKLKISPEAAASDTDARVKAAQMLIEKNPDAVQGYNRLAAAYIQLVRETGDAKFNADAAAALNRALEIDAQNYDALLLKTHLLNSEHRFEEGLETARRAEQINPHDAAVYGMQTDALTELGRYDEAVNTAQKMVDKRPDAQSYARVANLRLLHGDVSGALEAQKLASRIANPTDKEALAWHRVEIGEIYFNTGKFAEAEREYDAALQIFPEHHLALAGKAKTRAVAGDLKTAAEIYEKLRDRLPQLGRIIALGNVYQKLGRAEEAQKIYELAVNREREAGENGDMHRIAHFWADHDTNLDEALEIARSDREEFADLQASDTLAWCLYKKGDYAEAKKWIEDALRLKSKNAQFFYHAGMIHKALGNRREAAKFLKLALETNPAFDILQADKAKQALQDLS